MPTWLLSLLLGIGGVWDVFYWGQYVGCFALWVSGTLFTMWLIERKVEKREMQWLK